MREVIATMARLWAFITALMSPVSPRENSVRGMHCESPPPAAEPAVAEPVEAVEEPPAEEGETASLRAISQTVRVDIGKLDNLMNIVGELVINKTTISQISRELVAQEGFAGTGRATPCGTDYIYDSSFNPIATVQAALEEDLGAANGDKLARHCARSAVRSRVQTTTDAVSNGCAGSGSWAISCSQAGQATAGRLAQSFAEVMQPSLTGNQACPTTAPRNRNTTNAR